MRAVTEAAVAHDAQSAGRLRILHVVHGLSRGGLENGVVNLVNHLPALQFQQAVCCLERRGEMADRLDPMAAVFVMRWRRHSIALPVRLARLIRRWQADIVHCRNWNAWPDTAVACLLLRRRPSLVWSFHGFSDRDDEFPLRRCIASRLLAHGTDRLFAVCKDAAVRFAAKTGIPSDRFEVLYNGVDTECFRPALDRRALRRTLGLPLERMLILTVANLIPVKDHVALIDSATRMPRQQLGPVHFVFVGDGPLRSEVERCITERGLTNDFTLVGSSDRVADYYRAADLFVLPSRLEGMSNAILEAMASGLPVVANRVGGNPELVVDGTSGLLCRPNAPDDMVAALVRLISDHSVRAAMGGMARARAEADFSIEAMVDRYSQFYRSMAADHPVHGLQRLRVSAVRRPSRD
ncbi:MAG: glycosyltransferase [Nitrococcus sp.]|nr:glycosyltransferase [Nitrococcus sp.]